jgi:PH domain/C2 domain
MAATHELSPPVGERSRSGSHYERANPLLAHLVVVRGQGLAAKDSNGFSDPYVNGTLTTIKALEGSNSHHISPSRGRDKRSDGAAGDAADVHEVKFRTPTVKKSLHPQWAYRVYLGPFEPLTDVVQLRVWDKDPVPPNDFLGECTISLRECKKVGKYEFDEVLLSRPGRHDRVSGKVVVRVEVTESAKVIRQGYLIKKGHKRKNWRKRWFILYPNSLAYYVNPPGVSYRQKKPKRKQKNDRQVTTDVDALREGSNLRGRLYFTPISSVEVQVHHPSHPNCFTLHVFDKHHKRHLELRTLPDDDPTAWYVSTHASCESETSV